MSEHPERHSLLGLWPTETQAVNYNNIYSILTFLQSKGFQSLWLRLKARFEAGHKQYSIGYCSSYSYGSIEEGSKQVNFLTLRGKGFDDESSSPPKEKKPFTPSSQRDSVVQVKEKKLIWPTNLIDSSATEKD